MKTENGKETAYVYNSLNQLVSDSETSYEYDLNGNLVRVIGASHSALYEYNCENKLVKATVQQDNNVVEEVYTYDYAGNRTSKTTRTNGHVEFVKYLNDNSSLTNVLAEIGSDGTEKCVYTIGADLISQERDGKVSVYLYDGHGSVVGLATMGGKVTDTYTYDAFGNLLISTGSTKNYYRYCGEQFDETTGLYYLRARYMDTTTGRFISQDSYSGSISDPTSLHKYLYANSNPVMYSDPSGYMSVASMAVIGAISGAISGIIIPNVLSMLGNFDVNGKAESTLTPLENIKNALQGMIFGALFGVLFATGAVYVLAGISIFNGALSAIIGYSEYESGNYTTAIGYSILSIVSFLGFFKLFSLGNKNTSSASTSNNDVLGNVNGKTPAQQVADFLIDENNRSIKNPTNPGRRINTVAVFRSKDGQYVIGFNGSRYKMTGIMQNLLDFVFTNKYNGKCAEINAINNAIELGIEVEGGSISTSFVGGAKHGMIHNPCGVCSEVMWLLDIIFNGGW